MWLTDYIGNIKKTLSALKAAGGKIEDLNVIAIILDGLPSSFVHFCTTWDNRPDVDQTLDRLYNALMNADERLQKRDDDVMALAASKSLKFRRFEQKKSKNESKVNEKTKLTGKFHDSGASYHMAFDRKAFSSMEEGETNETIGLADNRRLSVKDIGQIKIEAWVDHQWKTVTMNNVRWIPELGKNLFSFKAATNHNFQIITSKQNVKAAK
ncbi:integrase core domain protein [Lasius niger]|uniref:Integrase core domain protein n=1 Tax=Lasius niger TaxID=67767 RepID=A0A0J7JWU6_LASNI|nr:integrase core domain protein [Lasius niger]